MKRNDSSKISKSLLRELPYYWINLLSAHGQFNNILADHLPSKKYLESLTSHGSWSRLHKYRLKPWHKPL